MAHAGKEKRNPNPPLASVRRWRSSEQKIEPMGILASGLRWFTLIAFALFFGLPLLWLLLAATKTDNQLIDLPPLAIGSPAYVIEAWRHLLTLANGIIMTWIFNSIYYTIASLILGIAVTIPAAYALGVTKFPGRKLLLWVTLISMMLPMSALVLPIYLEMNLAHLVNTPWSVILPGIFFPFGVYLAHIFYKVSLPRDLLDAARVDGCSELQVFWHIGAPLAKPLIGLLLFLIFAANWNSYFLPFVMLNSSDLFNLPVGMQAIMTGTPALRPNFVGVTIPIHRAEAALASIVLLLPVMLIFIFAQRFLTRGILSGTMKE
jgi:multiple sugar transport system permease protein